MISRVNTEIQTIVLLSESSTMNEKEAGIMEAGSRPRMRAASLSSSTESLPGVIINSFRKRFGVSRAKRNTGQEGTNYSHVCAF